MYGMKSYRANGERIQSVNEVPAFYALTVHGQVLEYFTTLEALHFACESLKIIELVESNTTEVEFKIAA